MSPARPEPVREGVADDLRLAERCAYILGDASSAALALADLAGRKARGEDAGIWLIGGVWVVGPVPRSSPAETTRRQR